MAGPDCRVTTIEPDGHWLSLVAAQLFVPGKYFAPVLKGLPPLSPPQMIIAVPVHTACVICSRIGAFVMLVAVQLFVVGIVSATGVHTNTIASTPPQTTITLPVHTAV